MSSDISTTIYSPYSLDENEIKEIVNKFPFINPDLINNVVDETVIAGFRISHGTKIIDLTLKSKLSNLKKKLYEAS